MEREITQKIKEMVFKAMQKQHKRGVYRIQVRLIDPDETPLDGFQVELDFNNAGIQPPTTKPKLQA